MDHNALFDSLKAGDTGPLYLFEGTEEYIKQQALNRLKGRPVVASKTQTERKPVEPKAN